jgi:hypothetical protein
VRYKSDYRSGVSERLLVKGVYEKYIARGFSPLAFLEEYL